MPNENEKQLTAVMQTIEKMQDAKDNLPNIGFDEEFIRGFNKAFQMAIFISQKFGLPTERQKLIDAYDDGILKGRYDDGEQYFDKTFKTQ